MLFSHLFIICNFIIVIKIQADTKKGKLQGHLLIERGGDMMACCLYIGHLMTL
jgi:hypothetical protein